MRDKIEGLLRAAVQEARDDGTIPDIEVEDLAVGMPRNEADGEWASAVAMRIAAATGGDPLDIATAIAARIAPDLAIGRVDVAEQGFIDFHLSAIGIGDTFRQMREQGHEFGRHEARGPAAPAIEFVPEGLGPDATMTHRRCKALGASLDRIAVHAGYGTGGRGGRTSEKSIPVRPAWLVRDGQPTLMPFGELLRTVGREGVAYALVGTPVDHPAIIDIEIAGARDVSNPVYRLLHTHASACSILRHAAGVGDGENGALDLDAVAEAAIGEGADYSLLTTPEERALARRLSEFPDIVEGCVRDFAPSRMARYAEGLADSFHLVYKRCRVLPAEGKPVDGDLSQARLAACDATRIVLGTCLGMLGIAALGRV